MLDNISNFMFKWCDNDVVRIFKKFVFFLNKIDKSFLYVLFICSNMLMYIYCVSEKLFGLSVWELILI